MGAMSNAALIMIGVMEAIGLTVAIWLFGGSLILPSLAALVACALAVRGTTATTTFILSHLVVGLYFAILLFADEYFWLNVLVGAVAIALLVQNIGTKTEIVSLPTEA